MNTVTQPVVARSPHAHEEGTIHMSSIAAMAAFYRDISVAYINGEPAEVVVLPTSRYKTVNGEGAYQIKFLKKGDNTPYPWVGRWVKVKNRHGENI